MVTWPKATPLECQHFKYLFINFQTLHFRSVVQFKRQSIKLESLIKETKQPESNETFTENLAGHWI